MDAEVGSLVFGTPNLRQLRRVLHIFIFERLIKRQTLEGFKLSRDCDRPMTASFLTRDKPRLLNFKAEIKLLRRLSKLGSKFLKTFYFFCVIFMDKCGAQFTTIQ